MDQIFSDPWVYSLGLGIGGPILILLIRGYLHSDSEVKRLIAESERKDSVIDAKDAYIKDLVAAMNEQNDVVRNTMVPTLNTILQETLKGKAANG